MDINLDKSWEDHTVKEMAIAIWNKIHWIIAFVLIVFETNNLLNQPPPAQPANIGVRFPVKAGNLIDDFKDQNNILHYTHLYVIIEYHFLDGPLKESVFQDLRAIPKPLSFDECKRYALEQVYKRHEDDKIERSWVYKLVDITNGANPGIVHANYKIDHIANGNPWLGGFDKEK